MWLSHAADTKSCDKSRADCLCCNVLSLKLEGKARKMSILAGPYHKTGDKTKEEDGGELLVFGYACKLFRDDAKAILEDSGQLLIPWMGDSSLMVDR